MSQDVAGEQITMFDLDTWSGKMYPEPSAAENPTATTSESYSRKPRELRTAEYLFLDLRSGAGNLLGPCWESNSPSLEEYWTLNTGPAPHSGAAGSSLSQILEDTPHQRYYLSKTACLGILRRAKARGKELPLQLKSALEIQAEITDA